MGGPGGAPVFYNRNVLIRGAPTLLRSTVKVAFYRLRLVEGVIIPEFVSIVAKVVSGAAFNPQKPSVC